MKKRGVITLYSSAFLMALFLLVLPFIISSSYYHNSLQNLPDWGVSKQHVTMELMGSVSYENGSQALAGNQLHLEAWHGYHEVMYRKKIVPRSIEFSFFLGENSWICLIFNRPRPYAYDVENYCALRLSNRTDKPAALLQVDAFGKFLDRTPLDIRNTINMNAWNNCSVIWSDTANNIEVKINGNSLGSFTGDFGNQQHIGFRGGANPAIVDNVRIIETSRARYFYSFNWYEGLNRNRIIYNSIFIATKIALAIVLALLVFRWFTGDMRTAAAISLSCCFTVILVLWPWTYYRVSIMAQRYPLENDTLLKIERILIDEGIQTRREEIRGEYPADFPFPENTVVLLGSSQTWGSGATLREHTWANKLEPLLTGETSSNVLLINGAIKGATSKLLYPYYEEFLSLYPHKLLVMVLGCNDRDENILRENLVRFITLARSKQSKPVLVIEAFSYDDHANGTGMRSVMESVASEYNVPLFDMHNAVKEYQDAGFFWWDTVHPTSFGHDCIAHVLAPFIRECLETE